MKMLRYCRTLTAFLACLLLATLLCAATVVAQETEDSQLFLAGFNAYQQKDFPGAVTRLGGVLQKFPETPLRDMTLFWLARAHYKAGNHQEAGRYMALFTREYPDNPLRSTAEEELLALAARHEKTPDAATRVAAAVQAEDEKRRAAAEADRLAQEKATQEAAQKAQILKAKAEAEQAAREKAESDRLAAQKREEEQRQAALEAEQQKAAAQTAEHERKAREKAEADRLAALKAQEERLLKEKAAAERLAAQKADEERRAAEKAAAAAVEQKEREQAAARKAAAERSAAEKLRQERAGMKDRAIAEYQGILSRFPDSPAARTAAARLKELGIAVAVPAAAAAGGLPESAGTAQVLTLEVAQYAAFAFDLQSPVSPVEVARKTAVPFEIRNQGNGQDSFYLASAFPAEFGARFAALATPEQSINQTPLLAPGELFKGLLQLNVPPSVIDGLRIAHPVKAASQFMKESSQSRVVMFTAAAPLLRAVIKTDKQQLLPGDRLQYRVAVLNVGSTPARDVSLRLNYPAQYQPVDGAASGFRQEMNAALVLDGLALKSGESRDLTVTFQLKDEALAKEELMVRADLVNNVLQTRGTFLSNTTFVLPVSDLEVRMAHQQITAVPGQTLSVPVRIVNKGNQWERFSLVAASAPFQKTTIYHDLNRDGLRQPGEPEVSAIGPLGPREEAALLLEVATSKLASDGAREKLSLTAVAETAPGKQGMADVQVAYSRPVLHLTMKGREGRMVPGELLTVELDVLNRGSNLARLVELEVSWPDEIELVTADQAAGRTQAGASIWRFNELGAGEKRIVKASFRIRPGTGVGRGVQLKSVLTYQDHAGNRY